MNNTLFEILKLVTRCIWSSYIGHMSLSPWYLEMMMSGIHQWPENMGGGTETQIIFGHLKIFYAAVQKTRL